jgi:hypothetical protein
VVNGSRLLRLITTLRRQGLQKKAASRKQIQPKGESPKLKANTEECCKFQATSKYSKAKGESQKQIQAASFKLQANTVKTKGASPSPKQLQPKA